MDGLIGTCQANFASAEQKASVVGSQYNLYGAAVSLRGSINWKGSADNAHSFHLKFEKTGFERASEGAFFRSTVE